MDERLKGAIEAGDEATVERLVAENPSLTNGRDGGLSAVMLAAYHKQEGSARAILAARGPADLFEAAALGLDRRVHEFTEWDPRAVTARSDDGFTALHLAAYFGRTTAVRQLIDADAYVDAVAENGTRVCPLHSAVAGGNPEVVRALLAAGAEVDARQERGFTPLMGAAAGGSEEIARALLDAGADRAATSDDGQTALDIAHERGHEGLEALLG